MKQEIGIPFYATEQDYRDVLRLVPAAESCGAIPYADFLKFVEKARAQATMGGYLPVRVKIEPQAVKVWCEAKGVPVCRKSISAYGMAMLGNRLLRLDDN
jgi:hypothetical protein